jgi:hypothetical protein
MTQPPPEPEPEPEVEPEPEPEFDRWLVTIHTTAGRPMRMLCVAEPSMIPVGGFLQLELADQTCGVPAVQCMFWSVRPVRIGDPSPMAWSEFDPDAIAKRIAQEKGRGNGNGNGGSGGNGNGQSGPR